MVNIVTSKDGDGIQRTAPRCTKDTGDLRRSPPPKYPATFHSIIHHLFLSCFSGKSIQSVHQTTKGEIKKVRLSLQVIQIGQVNTRWNSFIASSVSFIVHFSLLHFCSIPTPIEGSIQDQQSQRVLHHLIRLETFRKESHYWNCHSCNATDPIQFFKIP